MTSHRGALSRVLDHIARVALVLAGLSILGMAFVEGWQVFARYVLNDSPSWTEPVALLFMSTTMMLSAALGVRTHRHFGFFILVENASVSMRRALRVFAWLIAAAIGVMLAAWGGEMMIDAWDFAIAGAPLPQGITYLPLCIGGALIALFAIEHVFTRDDAQEAEVK